MYLVKLAGTVSIISPFFRSKFLPFEVWSIACRIVVRFRSLRIIDRLRDPMDLIPIQNRASHTCFFA